MVHALLESRRVLKPDGLLIDLRPASVHRRVGFAKGDSYRLRWVMREHFDDDRAADRAVAQVVSEKLFKVERRLKFDCYRVMDRIEEFVAWLDDFINKGNFESHDWLVRRLERKLQGADAKTRIVVSAPLVLRALRKT